MVLIRILLCCGGGFSSSYVAEGMKRVIKERHLDNEVSIDFQPFAIVDEKKDEFDVVCCCPHLKMVLVQYLKTHLNPGIPFYLLPPRMYGRMELDYIVEDSKDVIRLYQKDPSNPVHFPGEDNLLRIRRYESYRRIHGGINL